MNGDLFYTGYDSITRRCVRKDEILEILKAFHDEPCGGHFADKRTSYIILNLGYYWSSIFKYSEKYVRSCDICQRMGRLVPSDEMPPIHMIKFVTVFHFYFHVSLSQL